METNLTTEQKQTKAALQRAITAIAKKSGVSNDEKRAQAERELQRRFFKDLSRFLSKFNV